MKRNQGFTLLELMAVIFIIGLSLGLASLAITTGGPKEQLCEEIEKFMVTAEFAGERAILSGETMGLVLEPPLWQAQRGQDADEIGWRYKWVRKGEEGWEDIQSVPPVTFPPTTEFMVEVDELLWDYENQLDRTVPIMALSPSGDITNIMIEITDEREPDFEQHIEVDETGVLSWREAPKRPEDDDD